MLDTRTCARERTETPPPRSCGSCFALRNLALTPMVSRSARGFVFLIQSKSSLSCLRSDQPHRPPRAGLRLRVLDGFLRLLPLRSNATASSLLPLLHTTRASICAYARTVARSEWLTTAAKAIVDFASSRPPFSPTYDQRGIRDPSGIAVALPLLCPCSVTGELDAAVQTSLRRVHAEAAVKLPRGRLPPYSFQGGREGWKQRREKGKEKKGKKGRKKGREKKKKMSKKRGKSTGGNKKEKRGKSRWG